MKPQLIVATKNRKKLKEIKELLKDLDLKVISLSDFPNPPRIIENGKTFRENAIKKALKTARFTGKLTLGEDSGLCVDILGGKPGIHSSRFAGKGKSDLQNNLKLLKLLKDKPLGRRKAHYVCAIALADKNSLIATVEARCYGVIGFQLKGTYGFGYDPLFIIPKYKKTFAQLGEQIKHKMSHRFLALEKAKKVICAHLKS
ncbi:MAG: non-canonical purine NTP pyrophosphatase, RdgB/HAM1 family [Candidatus Omnitrophota bacterium]|nr:MAG: non-canonical purine NTP pyrophosphatase, RdgB/HAM1 family [Candidatus Omnitrophota bacterium]